MTRLSARLAVNLSAAAVIGLLAVDVVYVFAAQREAVATRRLALSAAAHEAAVRLRLEAREPSEVVAALRSVAGRYAVVLTFAAPDGHLEQSEPLAGVPLATAARSPTVAQGFEHLSLPLGEAGGLVIASRPLEETVTRVMAEQPRVLVLLGLAAALITVFGLSFMRRSVLQPIERITTWARTHDEAAISTLGQSSDGLAELGRAIIAMNQRGDDDRRRIHAQLQELQQAHDELRATRDQLVRAERLAAVGRLAAGLAHEIGNPLAVLTGFVGVLDDATLTSEQRRDAHRRMEKELARIQGTVRSLLDFSRAPTSVGGTASIREVFAQLAALLEPQAKKKQVRLAVQAPELAVAMDANALTQVLLNLALNALDAAPSGGSVEVSGAARDGRAELVVADDGPGVPAELVDKIFEPFFTTKPAGHGTGLGLSVCESLVHAAGGVLSLDRGASRGARFVVALPLRSPG